MPKKKINIGYSSKNGQKELEKKFVHVELSREQINELTAQHQEMEIDFPPSKISDFERMVYETCEIIAEFQKSQGRSLEPNHHQEFFRREIQDEFFRNVEKLYLLIDHYGIDPKDEYRFVSLSIELARELFPYSPAKPKGRKPKWSKSIEAIFVIDMEKLIKKGKTGKTISNAANILASDPIWSNFIDSNTLAKTIRTEYSKIRKKDHIKESRKQFDQMTQAEFEEQRKKHVRKLPTF